MKRRPTKQTCLFKVGDTVTFEPSPRTKGHYQNIEGFGVKIGETLMIRKIVDDYYLYFDNNRGGWPWNEFKKGEQKGTWLKLSNNLEDREVQERVIKHLNNLTMSP